VNASLAIDKPALDKPVVAKPRSVPRRPKTIGGAGLGQDTPREARRLAAAILEVLAGARTPSEAATALGLSVPRYYQVESQALAGLLSACAPRPKGRQGDPGRQVAALRKDNERLQREVSRQQALARAVQRTVGWSPPALPPKATAAKAGGKPGTRKPRQRRLARALGVAARLRDHDVPVPEAAVLPTLPVSG